MSFSHSYSLSYSSRRHNGSLVGLWALEVNHSLCPHIALGFYAASGGRNLGSFWFPGPLLEPSTLLSLAAGSVAGPESSTLWPWALPGILGLVGSLGRPSYVLQCYTSAFITGVLGVVLDYFCSLTCATSTTTNLFPLHPSYLISLIGLHFGAELHTYMDA